VQADEGEIQLDEPRDLRWENQCRRHGRRYSRSENPTLHPECRNPRRELRHLRRGGRLRRPERRTPRDGKQTLQVGRRGSRYESQTPRSGRPDSRDENQARCREDGARHYDYLSCRDAAFCPVLKGVSHGARGPHPVRRDVNQVGLGRRRVRCDVNQVGHGRRQVQCGANQVGHGRRRVRCGAKQVGHDQHRVRRGASQVGLGRHRVRRGANQVGFGRHWVQRGANQVGFGRHWVQRGASQVGQGRRQVQNGARLNLHVCDQVPIGGIQMMPTERWIRRGGNRRLHDFLHARRADRRSGDRGSSARCSVVQSVSRGVHGRHQVRRGARLCLRVRGQVRVGETPIGSMECWNRHGENRSWTPEEICGPNPADAISRVGRAGRSVLRGVRAQVVAPCFTFKSSVVDVAGSRDQFTGSVAVRRKLVLIRVIVSRVFQRVWRFAGNRFAGSRGFRHV
jgi:hypothetical protein